MEEFDGDRRGGHRLSCRVCLVSGYLSILVHRKGELIGLTGCGII